MEQFFEKNWLETIHFFWIGIKEPIPSGVYYTNNFFKINFLNYIHSQN
jgi:hypothetical protein